MHKGLDDVRQKINWFFVALISGISNVDFKIKIIYGLSPAAKRLFISSITGSMSAIVSIT